MSEKLEANQNRFSREAVDAHHGQLESRIGDYCEALDLPYKIDKEDGLFIDGEVFDRLDEGDLWINMKRNLYGSWLNLNLAQEAVRWENNPTAAILPTRDAEKLLDWVEQEPDRIKRSQHGKRAAQRRSQQWENEKAAKRRKARKQWQSDRTLTISEVARRLTAGRDGLPKFRTIRSWIAPDKPQNKPQNN